MDSYVTGAAIKHLREEKNMTQADLAERLEVSPKTVSKWETGRGLPDVSLLDSLAAALGVSLIELMNGASIVNRNVSGNLLRAKFYCCPVCGNVLYALGEATVSCCGVLLPPLEAEEADEAHFVSVETVEDERFVSVRHEMSKQHYISFLAHVSTDRLQLTKLYPEGEAACRFKIRPSGWLYLYCNRHGLMKMKL